MPANGTSLAPSKAGGASVVSARATSGAGSYVGIEGQATPKEFRIFVPDSAAGRWDVFSARQGLENELKGLNGPLKRVGPLARGYKSDLLAALKRARAKQPDTSTFQSYTGVG